MAIQFMEKAQTMFQWTCFIQEFITKITNQEIQFKI